MLVYTTLAEAINSGCLWLFGYECLPFNVSHIALDISSCTCQCFLSSFVLLLSYFHECLPYNLLFLLSLLDIKFYPRLMLAMSMMVYGEMLFQESWLSPK